MSQRTRKILSSLLTAVLTLALAGVASAGQTSSNNPHGDVSVPNKHAKQNHCGCTHAQGSSNNSNPATNQAVTPTKAATNASAGMPTWYISPMLISLGLQDTPLPWKTAVGPSLGFTLAYNQMDIDQPATFGWSNVGPKWTFNWLSYIQDDPAHPGRNVLTYLPKGPGRPDQGFNASTGEFAPEVETGAQLVEVSSDPVVYERRFPDGSKDVYAQSNGATSYPRRVFMTERVDTHGNVVTLHYDDQQRLISVDNAVGQALQFHYDDADHPLRLTRVSDGNGRDASLQYDSAGRLSGITDVMGMTSTFAYAAGASITAMTTPYGTTHFATHIEGDRRWIDITDADGEPERWEFYQEAPGVPFSVGDVPSGIHAFDRYLNDRDSFFWDASTLKKYGVDYTKALNYHWAHQQNHGGFESMTSDTLESIKYPLESRIWYNHPGDIAGGSGALNVPSAVARVLPDGSTQIRSSHYDAQGRLASTVDPSGLETDYTYAPDGIDIAKIERKGADGTDSVETFTYDAHHDVLTHTDETGAVTTFTYNNRGQVLSRTDALGQTTRYTYDAQGNRTSVTDATGAVTHFTYDALGRVTGKTDPLGRTTRYQYDALGRLIRTTYADGSYTATTWNKLDKASVRDRDGHVTRYTYDAMRHRTSATDALGNTTQWAYYPNGLLKSVTDPEGHVTTYRRDIEGRVTAVVDANGNTTATTYDSADRRTRITNALGQTTTVAYDKMDRPVRVTDANQVDTDSTYTARGWLASVAIHADAATTAATTTFAYDAHGDRTAVTDADGVTTGYDYDADHRLASITDALGNTEVFTRDADGRITAAADAASGSTHLAYLHRFAYDAAGQRIASIDADGHATRYHYDKAGHLAETIDANGVRTATHIDPAGHLLTSVQGIPGHHHGHWHPPFSALDMAIAKTAYAYDADGQLTSVTDPGGLTTHYAYDADGHKIRQDSPDTGVTTYAYDAVGNLVATTDARGTHSERTYDALHRLLSIHYPSDASEDVHYVYDQPASQSGCASTYAIGHVSRMTDPSGSTTYCYDARGKVAAEQRNISGTTYALAYAWTPAERLASLTYPSGVTVAYQRNADGQATTITEQGPHDAAPVTVVSHVARLPFGPVSRIAFGSDGKLAQTRIYDANYRGTAVQGLGLNLRVQRDAIGNIVALRTHRHQYQPDERYGYDTLQRLTDVTGPWGFLEQRYAYNTTGDRTRKITPDDGLVRYDYQPGSHRLAAINHGLGWSWGGWNPFCRWNQRYCQRSGDVLTDANGNITQMPHDSATLSLAYGANNRLTQVATSHGGSTTYLYNGLGQRVEKVATNPDQSRDFIYDGTQLLAERTAGSDDARAYIWLGHTLIVSLDTTSKATSIHYVATDFLGTPRRVTTTGGDTVWSWHYAGNPFGETPPQGSYTFNLRFPGQYHDALTGTNYNIHRDYSPAQGRYVESDPLGLAAGMSTYGYVGGNVLLRKDPDGHGVITSLIGGVLGGIAGYEAGGWKGALVGGVVGAAVGLVDPLASDVAAGAVVDWMGSDAAGVLAGTAASSAVGAVGGVVGDAGYNFFYNETRGACQEKRGLFEGAGYAAVLGGMAPLMSGEAVAAGVDSVYEGVVSEGMKNGYAVATGVVTDTGEALDPGAEHGFGGPESSEVAATCECKK